MPTAKVYTVGQINTYVKNMFAGDYLLNHLYIKGEVSNCKYHTSGHIYFTLKDSSGAIACVMFKGSRAAGLGFLLKDGQSVIVCGSVTVYERDGRYQMYVKEITLDGAGDLYLEYERTKQKLYEEGLFEFDIKKPIPKYPKKVGIVTAPTGAAIEDIKNIAKRRNPYVQLILYPAKVQGEGAAKTIVKGIHVLDQMGLDTIIIGRGGGSIEDLWAFNEEIVARAIFHANTPIISGTGHEIDNTIADYAADLRAPTPSAACELAIPDLMGFLERMEYIDEKMYQLLSRKVSALRYQLESKEARLNFLNPVSQLRDKQLMLDELSERLHRAMDYLYTKRVHELAIFTERLHGLSPTAKLKNGFGYIEDAKGVPVTEVGQLKVNDTVHITIDGGQIKANVLSVKEDKKSE